MVGALFVVGFPSIGLRWSIGLHQGLRVKLFRLGLLPVALLILLPSALILLLLLGLLGLPRTNWLLLFSGRLIGSLLWLWLYRFQEVAVHLALAHIRCCALEQDIYALALLAFLVN